MSNAMKYIKDLEAPGFQRQQAEAQVQMVLDALEGDLVTKSDFALFKADMKADLSLFQEKQENRFAQIDNRFRESEMKMTIRLGFRALSIATISVAILGWLIRV